MRNTLLQYFYVVIRETAYVTTKRIQDHEFVHGELRVARRTYVTESPLQVLDPLGQCDKKTHDRRNEKKCENVMSSQKVVARKPLLP
jgi:hypothetical protein